MYVHGLRLADKSPSVRRHVDHHLLLDLPHRPVQVLVIVQVVRKELEKKTITAGQRAVLVCAQNSPEALVRERKTTKQLALRSSVTESYTQTHCRVTTNPVEHFNTIIPRVNVHTASSTFLTMPCFVFRREHACVPSNQLSCQISTWFLFNSVAYNRTLQLHRLNRHNHSSTGLFTFRPCGTSSRPPLITMNKIGRWP